MFDSSKALDHCSAEVLWTFIHEVRRAYQNNPFHNFRHAVDVTHTMYRFLKLTARAPSALAF